MFNMLIAQEIPDGTDVNKLLMQLGVGGIVAVIIFFFYRKDVKQYTELWKTQSEILISVVKENTASNTRLIASLDLAQVTQTTIINELRSIRRMDERFKSIDDRFGSDGKFKNEGNK